MGWLKLFAGKTPEALEAKGDQLFSSAAYGEAKLEYEKAAAKLNISASEEENPGQSLEQKIGACNNALAREHLSTANMYADGGHVQQAVEWLTLALELTVDEELSTQIQHRLEALDLPIPYTTNQVPKDAYTTSMVPLNEPSAEDSESLFAALLNTLSDSEQQIYSGYGDVFKQGFLALHQGEFSSAVELLDQVMKTHDDPGSYVAIELATAHLNMENHDQARILLENFLDHRPQVLRAYSLLCEIYWATEDFDSARRVLENVPETGQETLAIWLLRGETERLAGALDAAERLYQDCLETFGWHDDIAKALADIYDAKGDLQKAKAFYARLMKSCGQCGGQVDPYVQRKFADTLFRLGEYTTQVLEIYLSLALVDPSHQATYYQRASRIYARLGNQAEARRFNELANMPPGNPESPY